MAPGLRVAYGDFLPSKQTAYEEASRMVTSQKPQPLSPFVCMNLKKYGGSSSTDKKELQIMARANKDLLNKLLELCGDLDYVICGGPDVKHLAKKLVAPHPKCRTMAKNARNYC